MKSTNDSDELLARRQRLHELITNADPERLRLLKYFLMALSETQALQAFAEAVSESAQ